jgi:hypothetical protein
MEQKDRRFSKICIKREKGADSDDPRPSSSADEYSSDSDSGHPSSPIPVQHNNFQTMPAPYYAVAIPGSAHPVTSTTTTTTTTTTTITTACVRQALLQSFSNDEFSNMLFKFLQFGSPIVPNDKAGTSPSSAAV